MCLSISLIFMIKILQYWPYVSINTDQHGTTDQLLYNCSYAAIKTFFIECYEDIFKSIINKMGFYWEYGDLSE